MHVSVKRVLNNPTLRTTTAKRHNIVTFVLVTHAITKKGGRKFALSWLTNLILSAMLDITSFGKVKRSC